jgi:hypothetical protein
MEENYVLNVVNVALELQKKHFLVINHLLLNKNIIEIIFLIKYIINDMI